MKKRTISKLKSIFGSKKGKRQQESKCSRSPSPESAGPATSSSGESFRPIQRTPPPSRLGPPPSPPVPTNPVAPVAPEPSGPLPLSPCPVCGRTFVPQSLAKHVKICEKMTVKKRKTFDSSRQRREGTDLEQYLPKNFGLPENSPFLEKSPPNTAKATPKPKTHSVRSAIMKPTTELQKCPHCSRAFGVRAFERHVEWCADKAKILPAAPAQPPQHIADAKQRLNARTQYKAPPVRGRRSSQSREKSSNSRSASVESSRGISPPRDCGDYRYARTRASESASSNDCQDDVSPHVPVIRNSRMSQNNSSGDANVKARQARLARDISNSRETQESHSSSVQQTNTDPNLTKQDTKGKPKNKWNARKKQQLKKLEQIANKYNERNQNFKSDQKTKDTVQKPEKKEISSKSQIPIPRRTKSNKCKEIPDKNNDVNLNEEVKQTAVTSICSNLKSKDLISSSQVDLKSKNLKKTLKMDIKKKIKESTMSLDSLEDCPLDSNQTNNCQSIGINTELLCPCIPCVIHDTSNQKTLTRKRTKEKNKKYKEKDQSDESMNSNDVVKLLYKNPNMQSTRTTENKNEYMDSIENISVITFNQSLSTVNNLDEEQKEIKNKQETSCTESLKYNEITENVSFDKDLNQNKNIVLGNNIDEDEFNLSAENREDNYEHDLSGENFDDSFDNKDDSHVEENGNSIECRHGSGDTYTKFTEDPADLEEFLNITDKMLFHSEENKQTDEIENSMKNMHTPQTDSLESINKNSPSNGTHEKSEVIKYDFSDTLKELKSNLKNLLQEADNEIECNKNLKSPNENEVSRDVCDMEHITVYGLKFYDQQETTDDNNCIVEEKKEIKLPSIKESNKSRQKGNCYKKKISNIYKINRKNNMLSQQKRTDNDYRTFIINESHNDNSDEAPPFKLPRIENKRLDDNYDPFVSAARQMKELMSSDTNIPKKIHSSSKDPNRTLPSLRPNREKASTLSRSENAKTIKDTINKTYQKTPTLQRMKSFGSTNNDSNNSFGGRCSSFRLNRNDKKPCQKLNTTFTKSSKENISSNEKTYFNRSSNLNRSFSSYSNSSYSTPKLKDKIPKISQSMHHGFQRSTIKQPLKLDKINNKNEEKKDFVNLDAILSFDNASMTDSNYIDPRLINENDNLPINVNTILNNPDIISSMESLLTTENLPAKFESFNNTKNNNDKNIMTESLISNKSNNLNKLNAPNLSDFSSQYDKIMSSLEQSIASKTSIRDDDSLCEDFDLEEFMTSFDDEVHKQRSENKRTCSSTTRVVAQSQFNDVNGSETKVVNSPKLVTSSSNGMIPVNKSMSLVFSSNNIVNDKLFLSSVKRSTSLLDSIQRKSAPKNENTKGRHKSDQLEEDLMQSLKDFDKFYESERNDNQPSNKEIVNNNKNLYHETISKKELRRKMDHKSSKSDITNGNHTPNGKTSNDSAYSSLNRISPSKLSLCNSKEPNGLTSLEQIPAGSDSSGSHKDDIRSISSEEFLAMERSAELDAPLPRTDMHKESITPAINDKRACSRASSRHGTAGTGGARRARRETLSSSGSEGSLQAPAAPAPSAPRLSRFCHQCGTKFPVDSAKFCIECGVKRLLV